MRLGQGTSHLAAPGAGAVCPWCPFAPSPRKAWQYLPFAETPQFTNVPLAVTGVEGLCQGNDLEATKENRLSPCDTRWEGEAAEG